MYGNNDKYFSEINVSIRNNDLPALGSLITNARDINVIDKDGNTILHIATALRSCPAMLKILDANADINIANNLGRTPLHVAALYDNFKAVNILVTHGSKVNAQDSLGFTPLHCLSIYDSVDTIMAARLLCESQADISLLNIELVSPLVSAIKNGSYCITSFLLHKSKNHNSEDHQKALLQMSMSADQDIRNLFRRLSPLLNKTHVVIDR